MLKNRQWEIDANRYFVNTVLAIAFIHICLVLFAKSYKNILRRGRWVELKGTLEHVVWELVGILCFAFFAKNSIFFTRGIAIGFFVLSVILIFIERTIWKYILLRYGFKEERQRLLVLVADCKNAEMLLERILGKALDIHVAGVICLDTLPKSRTIEGIPVVADENTAMEYLSQNVVDEVLFSASASGGFLETLIENCQSMGLTVHLDILKGTKAFGVKTVEELAGITVLSSYVKAVMPWQLFLKRIMDVAGAIVGLVITGVLALFLVPAIFFADPGPVFFSQIRIGKNGRRFRIYKFRSMYQNAEEKKKELMEKNQMQGHMFKMDEDPRIIGSGPDGKRHGVGHFIRSTSLDEFPQFWNVLKGDMSLVGTRPPTVDEWKEYEIHHRARMAVKPGLTGLWQVSGRSDITDFEEGVRLDTKYIQNWSLMLDLKIIAKTILVVILKKGSH